MPTTAGTIVDAVINLLSQVPGVATQVYSSGRILQHVQDALLLELEEMWWPDYMAYIGPIGVDGNGMLTADLVGPIATITEYRDIAAVFPADSNKKLREVPQSVNPLLLTGMGGIPFMMPDYTAVGRPFKVLPPASTTSVLVWARQRPPLPIATTTNIYLDPVLIQFDACWMYAVDDGTIPAQVNKFQVLAQNRRRMVKASYGQHSLELDPRFPADASLTSEWDGGYFVLDEDPLA